MTAFRSPSPLPNTYKALPSQEEQDRRLEECRSIDIANAKDWADMMIEWKELKAKVQEFLGYSHINRRANDLMRVWMSKGPLEHGLSPITRNWATRMAETFDALKRQEADAAKRKAEAEQKEHLNLKPARAVLFLIKNGKVEGQDFTPESAIYEANNLARTRLIESKMAEGGPFNFSGDDSCEDCDGWDGQERRCNCGNRRVDWEMSGDFKDFEIGHACVYGEAY